LRGGPALGLLRLSVLVATTGDTVRSHIELRAGRGGGGRIEAS
jgi:hypothetical protein